MPFGSGARGGGSVPFGSGARLRPTLLRSAVYVARAQHTHTWYIFLLLAPHEPVSPGWWVMCRTPGRAGCPAGAPSPRSTRLGQHHTPYPGSLCLHEQASPCRHALDDGFRLGRRMYYPAGGRDVPHPCPAGRRIVPHPCPAGGRIVPHPCPARFSRPARGPSLSRCTRPGLRHAPHLRRPRRAPAQ